MGNKNNIIKYKEVRISSLEIGSGGYTAINHLIPSGMNNFLFALVWNYGNTSVDFDVNADARYIRGTPYQYIDYVDIRYYYTD